jgi:hypothetical protein
MQRVRSRLEAEKRYGAIKGGVWANAAKWLAVLEIPERLGGKWVNSATRKPTNKIYCNREIHAPLLAALEALAARGLLAQLKTFDGAWSIRPVRGSELLSTHAYGLAIDLNAATNALGARPSLSKEFVACFTEQGFSWGGNFRRLDGMHFSLAWE